MTIQIKSEDDFTQISGIGKTKQTWLRESLGVSTFAALGKLSAETAATTLQEAGHPVTEGEMAEWITASAKLAADAAPVPTQPTDAWTTKAQFFVDFQHNATQPDEGEAWRIQVHRMKDGLEQTWLGRDNPAAFEWMRQQLKEEDPAEEKSVASPTPPLVINQLSGKQAGQDLGRGQDGQMFSTVLRAEIPFDLQLKLMVNASQIGQRASSVRVEVVAHHRGTGQTTMLGSMDQPLPKHDQPVVNVHLPQTTLQRGNYRVQAMATLPAWPGVTAFLEIPMLRVE